MGRRNKGRNISGIVLVDKHQGETSNAVLQRVKRLYGAAKAGHTGSLDPLATGVLPICLGEATKFSQYLLDSDKGYIATACFGARSDTGDAEGELTPVSAPDFTEAQLEQVMQQFRGPQQQVPPMYSALKVDGKPLYKLAREGIEIERKARSVVIYELAASSSIPDCEAQFRVLCSKGTYIRSLIQDMGDELGCGAYVKALRRFRAGPFEEAQIYTLEALEDVREEGGHDALDALLIPPDTAVMNWPEVVVGDASAYYISQGQPVLVPKSPVDGWVRIYQQPEEGERIFLGIGEVDNDGRIAPRRLIVR
ncbi:tRNA pseudouridine(55) synthase TruB [Aestuariirhabdus sp. Z084]|uniref:tRNA pseudouridine(55) synthase TruB n=1 Tax=Aestuariirhabdus haliotis TaxID=2918751 RepID=UPI00201B3622|nr:tRNA pseudouridine(55) synthase TruB [Aestuariirhabdus haliotis]MCL6415427.1 tRNA pseudouridine(55) synthase TruB [Aestuariirhabdus haliotis]MCL6419183.1 tRNA pseudouridine(55) synthase TruB [Aestuariirhabdus haliotis]